jgi:hypothetical protein
MIRAAQVIMTPTLKRRVETIVKFVDVAQVRCVRWSSLHARVVEKRCVTLAPTRVAFVQCLCDLNNFNGLMEICAGLALSVVARLKITWEVRALPH